MVQKRIGCCLNVGTEKFNKLASLEKKDMIEHNFKHI